MAEIEKIKVKCSPELFDEIKAIRHRVFPNLAGIVQNDMTITEEQLVEWNAEVKKVIGDIKDWRQKVLDHLEKVNRK